MQQRSELASPALAKEPSTSTRQSRRVFRKASATALWRVSTRMTTLYLWDSTKVDGKALRMYGLTRGRWPQLPLTKNSRRRVGLTGVAKRSPGVDHKVQLPRASRRNTSSFARCGRPKKSLRPDQRCTHGQVQKTAQDTAFPPKRDALAKPQSLRLERGKKLDPPECPNSSKPATRFPLHVFRSRVHKKIKVQEKRS